MHRLKSTIEDARFPHPFYERAVSEAVSRMAFMPKGSVVAMVGPTRVGKSSAIRQAARQVYPSCGGETIPYIVADASRTDNGFMSMRYLTLELLLQLEHPFYIDESPRLRLSQTETNARLQLRRAIHHRGTRLIIIDEAHHLLRVKNRAGLEAALESLKCLGNETGAVIFLVGGYQLLTTCFSSAHLNGRLSLFEFPRYRPEDAEICHFDKILASYDSILPWASGQSLLDSRELIYEGSLGCCGLIANWILSALAKMTASGANRLRREHFSTTRFTQQLDEILADISYGEAVLRPIGGGGSNSRAPGGKGSSEVNPQRPSHPRKPGRRRPIRDAVGKQGATS